MQRFLGPQECPSPPRALQLSCDQKPQAIVVSYGLQAAFSGKLAKLEPSWPKIKLVKVKLGAGKLTA